MNTANIFLHPALCRHPRAIAALERQTQCTATVVRRGRVVQLVKASQPLAADIDGGYPPSAA